MSANVETMMYVREKPWHGLGVRVEEAPTSADALRLAGLDWTVEQHDVIDGVTGEIIQGYKSNTRSSDGKALGIVGNRYKVVQNAEAFAFTDSLICGAVHYETAGSLNGGRRVWLLAKLPDTEICGDKTEPYMCFTNTHDGTGAIRVCMTPVRVVCNNTLNVALSGAKRSWSAVHTGDMQSKLAEAHKALDMACSYMDELKVEADHFANISINEARLDALIRELFPVKEDASDREKKTVMELRNEYMVCYYAPDISKFRGTAWGCINAMSDMMTHNAPHRNTKNYRENLWGKTIGGHPMVDAMVEAVRK